MSRLRHIAQLGIQIYRAHPRGSYIAIRFYATYKDHLRPSTSSSGGSGRSATSSLLSRGLSPPGTSSSTDGGSVGPFQLGMIPPSTKKAKEWAELSPTGKVARAALRSTNLIIIVLGAGFSGLLFYALASELFAKNSPTVLYNDVCERIKASPVVTSHLHPPLMFHTHPPLTHRPRHRARHVNSMLTTDAAGREHLFLNFYIEGSDPSKVASSSRKEESQSGAFEKIQNLLGSVSDLTAEEIIASGQRMRDKLWTKGRAAFAYLVGEPASLNPPASPAPFNNQVTAISSQAPPPPWSLSSIFTRLTGKRNPKSANPSHPYTEKRYWKSGEVHVDLVKVKESASDENGRFIVRYIVVNLPGKPSRVRPRVVGSLLLPPAIILFADIPVRSDSNNRNPVRLYVERTPDVSDHEAVIRWSS